MDCLRLRAKDTELIKNRLIFLSRTIWSERNPTALVFSVRKQNKNRETETNGTRGAETQRQKKTV